MKDYIGLRFGRLVVIDEVNRYKPECGKTYRRFKCLCDCGNITYVVQSELRENGTKSCGCLKVEKTIERSTKHGYRYHPIYTIWRHIKARCYNKNNKSYKNYGGRGITMCKEWFDYMTFHNWAIQNGWKKNLRIDRINVDDDYKPDNCRFVDAGVSARNKRLLSSNNTSGYRGLRRRANGKWQVKIVCDGQTYNLGTFGTAIEAAMIYDKKAIELNAEHPLNFPNSEVQK